MEWIETINLLKPCGGLTVQEFRQREPGGQAGECFRALFVPFGTASSKAEVPIAK
jgi:hypothetical protein